jgi:putative membrane protein
MVINTREFLKYKFFNSLFLGISVGSIFTLYAPLEPSIYSLGGIFLALAMLFVAKLYYKILNLKAFFLISLLVEVVILLAVLYFLLFNYSYTTALLIYLGYQFTFVFGSYLVRAETIFFPKAQLLTMIDVIKQKSYLLGMLCAYGFYKALEYFLQMSDKQDQVYLIHFPLLACELFTIYFLLKAFRK